MSQREAEVILKVNSQQAQEKLNQLEKKAADLRAKFAEAFRKGDTRGVDNLNNQLQKVDKEIRNIRTNAANIRAAMVRLNEASPRELQRTIKAINNELNSGRVKRGTKEWDDYVAKLKQVQGELQKVKREMQPDSRESFFDRIKNGINDWGASAAAASAAFAGVVMSGKAAVQTYADMQAEEANVRKYTGMTAEEVAKLNSEFKKMDTRTSREELNKLAQEAGRLGKTSQEDVLGFVRAADQINVALDDLGDGATLTLSKLTGIFGDEARYGTEQSLLKVGSVINELSQNCSASAPYLAEFSSRLGGIAAQSNMTISQVMAFGAVLDTNNLAVEASATAMGQLITKIYQEPAKIARAAGLDVQQFSQLVKSDMNGALISLFETLNQKGGMESLATVFDDMGTDGARAIPVLTALAGHVGELKNQQIEANKAFAEGTSVTNEFNVQNNTVQAQLDKARKGFTEMAVTLGEQLLPVMRYCISGTSLLMRVMSTLVTFITQHKSAILTLTAAIVAYNVTIRTAAISQVAHNVAMAAGNAVMGAARATYLLMSAGIALLTGGVKAATGAWSAFNIAIKSNPIGLIIGAIAAGITALTSWIVKNREAAAEEKRLAKERKQAQEDFRKGLNDISGAAADYASKEITRLKKLYDAATNVYKSQAARIKAARELQATYPATFGNLSTEAIMAGEAADAYLRLAKNIRDVARAEAAREKIKENEKIKIDLEFDNENLADQIGEQEELLDKLDDKIQRMRQRAGGNAKRWKEIKETKKEYAAIVAKLAELDQKRADNVDKMADADKANEKLQKIAEKTVDRIEKVAPSPKIADTPRGESDKERKEREKREREAKKAQREAERQAKEALKKDLDSQKAINLQAEAENLTMYVTGQRNYADYLDKKEALEKENAEKIIQIHEKHNKLDIAAYGQALKQQADLKKKQQDDLRKRNLNKIEDEHKLSVDTATSAYFDPNSPDFQNKKLLNQKLLQEDIYYLGEKQKLYAKGSDEWKQIQAQIDDRIAQDQLDKQKETAEALMQFQQQYGQSSGSLREQIEISILDELHAKGLISEEQYQRAVKEIKDKYRREDIDKARQTQSDYADMVLNLYESFSKFFSEMGKEGSRFWDNLANAAQAAYAIIGAALSQYSSYVNAERDLELAKVDKRYDKEIAAAGNNSKKKQKLEKQKEAETAKIKKKYNDKAMKIELAQAIAQTATAAIAAYASAAHIPFLGWKLGPIAAAMAIAAGMVQIATIKKQHEAQAAGYYEGGFTTRDYNNRREVGVVHANEFVANHEAVANPALSPLLRLIDTAQRNNTVGSLTAADVSNAIGQGSGVSARGEIARGSALDSAMVSSMTAVAQANAATGEVIGRLSNVIEDGIEAKVILDGEDGFHRRYNHYLKLVNNPKR